MKLTLEERLNQILPRITPRISWRAKVWATRSVSGSSTIRPTAKWRCGETSSGTVFTGASANSCQPFAAQS